MHRTPEPYGAGLESQILNVTITVVWKEWNNCSGWLHLYSVTKFITEVQKSIFRLRQFITRFRYPPSLIYYWTELFTTIRVFQTVTSPDETRMSGGEWGYYLHTFNVIIFLINLTWAVSVVALAPQPRWLAVRLGGEELVWDSSVLAIIAGASGNHFYYPLIIYSVSPFKSQLLKLFGASWKFLWKLSLANNFSVVIQPNLLFILDTWTDWSIFFFRLTWDYCQRCFLV